LDETRNQHDKIDLKYDIKRLDFGNIEYHCQVVINAVNIIDVCYKGYLTTGI